MAGIRTLLARKCTRPKKRCTVVVPTELCCHQSPLSRSSSPPPPHDDDDAVVGSAQYGIKYKAPRLRLSVPLNRVLFSHSSHNLVQQLRHNIFFLLPWHQWHHDALCTWDKQKKVMMAQSLLGPSSVQLKFFGLSFLLVPLFF